MLVSFFIMIAGFGAYFNQEYNINSLIGSSIIAFCSYFILKKDTKGLINLSEILVPIIIIAIFIIGLTHLDKNKMEINIVSNKNDFNFLKNSILYCSYNCIMLIPILITVKNYIKNKKSILLISIFSGIIILVMSVIMFFILNINSQDIKNIEIPMIYILRNHKYLKNIYGMIILFSITTTAISIGSGFIKNISKSKKSKLNIIKIMCISSVLFSIFGFSNLINIIYPIFGYIGILQILKLFI